MYRHQLGVVGQDPLQLFDEGERLLVLIDHSWRSSWVSRWQPHVEDGAAPGSRRAPAARHTTPRAASGSRMTDQADHHIETGAIAASWLDRSLPSAIDGEATLDLSSQLAAIAPVSIW